MEQMRDKVFQSLPEPAIQIVSFLYAIGPVLPEVPDPVGYYTNLSDAVGKQFLKDYGTQLGANTVIMPGFGSDITVHASSFRTGERELRVGWEKQVEWADMMTQRMRSEIPPSVDQVKEATYIRTFNSELAKTLGKLKKQLLKRGLPLPETSQMTSNK